MDSGNYEIFPSAMIVTLGYRIHREHLGIVRVTFTPPCVVKAKPEWWIDLLAPRNVTALNIAGRSTAVRVVRSSHQRTLGV
jgi:hypothetical protein